MRIYKRAEEGGEDPKGRMNFIPQSTEEGVGMGK